MLDHAGTNHIQIDVYQTPQQMLSGFDGGCMVAVLPQSTFALFSLIVLLGRSSDDQPHRGWDNLKGQIAIEFQAIMIYPFLRVAFLPMPII